VGTWDGTSKKIYVDGSLIHSEPTNPTIEFRGNFSIGRRSANSEGTTSLFLFDGLINDVRIYDHVLSQREINELAQAKILHYSFNKDEDIVYDITGYKNHGAKVGSLD
jgi:hypothetical protein